VLPLLAWSSREDPVVIADGKMTVIQLLPLQSPLVPSPISSLSSEGIYVMSLDVAVQTNVVPFSTSVP